MTETRQGERIIRSTCGICQIGCGVRVFLEGDRVVKIEGDPDHPLNRGVLCVKGIASMDYLYHPERLRRPLARTGRRGQGKWAEASWDEALSAIAGRLSALREQFGAESVVFLRGAAKGLQDDYLTRFANAFGSPNITSMAHVCFIPRRAASLLTYGFYAVPDLDYSPRLIIVWGNNVTDTLHHVYLRIRRAVQKGSRLIVIDPVRSTIAEMADLWVPLRPGGDLPLALAMLNVLVTESLYDRPFVDAYTMGFKELCEAVLAHTPEQMAGPAGVSAATIRELARAYTENRPSCIQWGNGIDHSPDNFQTARAISILRAITGNLGVAGGEMQWMGPSLADRAAAALSLQDRIPPEARRRRIMGKATTLPTLHYAMPQGIMDAVLTGEPYIPRVLFFQGCNALLTYPNAKKVHEVLEKVDFLVVSDLSMTPTALMADFVLPSATYLEFDSIVTPPYSMPVSSIQQGVTRIDDCRSDWEILKGLAEKLGFGDCFPGTEVDYLNQLLEPSGLSFEEFRKIGVLEGTRQERTFEGHGFSTPSKKVELFSPRLAEWGFDPVPSLGRVAVETEEDAEWPLRLTSWKTAPYRHSGGRQIQALRERHPEAVAIIHPATAARYGIREGTSLRIETPLGSIVQKAVLNETVSPLVVGVDFGWWFPENGEGTQYSWDRSNVNVVIDDSPPYGRELGTPLLRGLKCRINPA